MKLKDPIRSEQERGNSNDTELSSLFSNQKVIPWPEYCHPSEKPLTQYKIRQFRIRERANLHIDVCRPQAEPAPVDGFVARPGVDLLHDPTDGGVDDRVDGVPGEGETGGGDAEDEGRADHVVVEHVERGEEAGRCRIRRHNRLEWGRRRGFYPAVVVVVVVVEQRNGIRERDG